MTIYLGSYWVALQVIDFFIQKFGINIFWVKAFSVGGLCLVPSLILFAWFRFQKGWWYKQLFFYLINSAIIVYVLLGMNKDTFDQKNADSVAEKSVAILPFENLSGDPSQEYFSDGISEEILNALTQIKDLKVPGRASSFRFKHQTMDLQEIGEKLRVNNVLDGSVRKQGNRVRVKVELVSVKDGYRIWSQQFDRTLDDVFAIQEEIARTVTAKLKVTLFQNEIFDVAEVFAKNKEAYDAFLKGRYFWNKRSLKESEKYYKEAIALDSGYAAAYAGLAENYALFPGSGLASPLQAIQMTHEAANKAIQLDSMMAMPYLALAFVKCNYEWNNAEAKRYFKKALELNSRYAPIHYWFGQFLAIQEQNYDSAIKEMNRAVELEPLEPAAHLFRGIALSFAGKYKDALKALSFCVELNKQINVAYMFMGHCYLSMNQITKATELYEQSAKLGSQQSVAILVLCYLKQGKKEKAEKQLASLVEYSKTNNVSPFSLALAYSFLDQKEQAHLALKKSFEAHEQWIIIINNSPSPWPVEKLKSDPRNMELGKEYLKK
ncbi:MAG: tetratricopeptide repeat protein [Cyclobacteriaceae bacterium]